MARTVVTTRNFDADTNNTFPTGFTDLNSFSALVKVSNGSGSAGVYTVPFGNDADARDTGTFTDDQYVQFVLGNLSAGSPDYVGGGLRYGTGVTGGAGVTGYRVKAMSAASAGSRALQVNKVVAGTETLLGSTHTMTLNTSDIVSAECTGQATTSIAVYLNGVLNFTVTDSSSPILTGKPGICGIGNGGSTGDLYEAGNVVASSGVFGRPYYNRIIGGLTNV